METKDKKRPEGDRSRPSGSVKTRTRPSDAAEKTQKRRQTHRSPSPKRPTEDVVYTQPGPFNRNRFLLHLASVVAVVLAVLFGMSIFFKVDTVTVSGANKYTEWDVRQASGVQEGENLLSVSEARLGSNIRSKLPYVDTVRIGIELPGTVKIEITELDVVYAVESDNGDWWLMRADGGIIEKTTGADAQMYTKVLGVKITEPQVGSGAKAYQPVSEETMEGGTPVPVTVDAGTQLDIAITILQYMEENSIIGDAASIDVTDPGNLEMWYGERFQVELGDSTQLSYKIKLVKTAVDNYMETYDSGILDVSLTVQPDPEKEYQVIYTPFS